LGGFAGSIPEWELNLKPYNMNLLKIPFKSLFAPESLNIRVDYGDIQELADSIRESGLQLPLTVIQVPDKPEFYQVVDGFRRMRALSVLNRSGNLPELIPVLVRELTDTERLYLQCTGNSGANLSILELAELCRQLEDAGESLDTIARKTGKTRAYIDRVINLSYAPESVKAEIKAGIVSGSQVLKAMDTETFAGIENTIKQAKQILSESEKPVKIKLATTPAKHQDKAINTQGIESLLLDLYQESGNPAIPVIMEYLTGRISVSETSNQLKTI
jgi:ParB/RepB/Spo0J family partition protein